MGTPDIYALSITEFVDDYKLRGENPSRTETWYFDDVAKAYCQLHLWFKKSVLDGYELDAAEIEKRCKATIFEFEMKDWCFSNGVPLDDCPDLDTFLRAVCPAEYVPVKFDVDLTPITLTELDITKDDVEGLEYIVDDVRKKAKTDTLTTHGPLGRGSTRDAA